MRLLVAVALTLTLMGCQRQASAPTAQSGQGCTGDAVKQVLFSDPTRPDTVRAHGEGPSCGDAAITLTARSARGDVLVNFSAKFSALYGEDAAHSTQERLQAFLASWSDVTLKKTGALPEWRADAPSFGASVQGMPYSTPLDRTAYEQIRAKNLPDLCYAAGVTATQCVIIDPDTGASRLVVSFGA